MGATAAEVGVAIPGVDSVRWTRTTTRAVTVDATGTIYLPNGTITDVIRVRAYDLHFDEFESKSFLGWQELNIPGVVESPSRDTTITYSFYSTDFPLPVLNFTIGLDDSVGDGGISFHHPPRMMTVGRNEGQLNGFSLNPNPTQDGQLTLHAEAAWPSGLVVNVYNTAGQRVATRESAAVVGQSLELDLGEQPAGLYVVQISSSAGQWQQRVIKR